VRIRKLDDGSYIVDAKTDLEEFRNQTNLSLAIEEAEEGADTVGGLVVWLLGRVPPRGEIVTHPAGFEFEVLEADPRRVKRVRIAPPAKPVAIADDTVDLSRSLSHPSAPSCASCRAGVRWRRHGLLVSLPPSPSRPTISSRFCFSVLRCSWCCSTASSRAPG